jgi:hypothetical protein
MTSTVIDSLLAYRLHNYPSMLVSFWMAIAVGQLRVAQQVRMVTEQAAPKFKSSLAGVAAWE